MRGLKENCHEGTDGWLSVSSQLVLMYYNLCEVVSADMDHIRYRQELRLVNQSPCVPILSECLPKEYACLFVCVLRAVCVLCMHACMRACLCVVCVYAYMHMPTLTHCLRTYIGVVLEDVARVARDYPNTIPGAQGAKVINFQKHRMLSHIFSSVMKYQSAPYALLPVEPIQAFFSTLPEPHTEQIDQTSVQ